MKAELYQPLKMPSPAPSPLPCLGTPLCYTTAQQGPDKRHVVSERILEDMIEVKTGPLMLGLDQQKDLGREQEEDSMGLRKEMRDEWQEDGRGHLVGEKVNKKNSRAG